MTPLFAHICADAEGLLSTDSLVGSQQESDDRRGVLPCLDA